MSQTSWTIKLKYHHNPAVSFRWFDKNVFAHILHKKKLITGGKIYRRRQRKKRMILRMYEGRMQQRRETISLSVALPIAEPLPCLSRPVLTVCPRRRDSTTLHYTVPVRTACPDQLLPHSSRLSPQNISRDFPLHSVSTIRMRRCVTKRFFLLVLILCKRI